jgi:hypothetical protein
VAETGRSLNLEAQAGTNWISPALSTSTHDVSVLKHPGRHSREALGAPVHCMRSGGSHTRLGVDENQIRRYMHLDARERSLGRRLGGAFVCGGGARERMKWALQRRTADANPDVCHGNVAFQLVVAPPGNPVFTRDAGTTAQQLRKRGATTSETRRNNYFESLQFFELRKRKRFKISYRHLARQHRVRPGRSGRPGTPHRFHLHIGRHSPLWCKWEMKAFRLLPGKALRWAEPIQS